MEIDSTPNSNQDSAPGHSDEVGNDVPSDATTAQVRDEVPEVLREPLMPQISIRSLIILTVISAVLMVVFQQAFMAQKMWAMAISLTLILIGVVLVLYAGSFLLANIFSSLSRSAVHVDPVTHVHSPTLVMPEQLEADHQSVAQSGITSGDSADGSDVSPGAESTDGAGEPGGPPEDPPGDATEASLKDTNEAYQDDTDVSSNMGNSSIDNTSPQNMEPSEKEGA